MPTALIGAAITGGASLAGGLLNRPKTTTASTQPVYTPEQQQLQAALSGKLTQRLNNPANLEPLKTAAVSQVNRNFDTLQTGLERRLAARGFGSSGKLVTNTKDLAVKRGGALGDLESKFAGLQLDQENDVIDQTQRFAFGGAGSQSQQTSPGNVPGGAISSGAETAALLYALNHFLGGGSPGGINPAYAENDLGGYSGAGPQRP